MCFSAEASFVAAVVLGSIGAFTIKKCQSKRELFLALIPLLFGIQQFSEGIVWLYKNGQIHSNLLLEIGKNNFLFFAYIFWPIWIPLSFALIEKVKWRTSIILLDLVCGCILSSINFYFSLGQDITVTVMNYSIQYGGVVIDQRIIYPIIVLLPMFLTSLKNTWIFGCLVAVSYGISYYFYEYTFTSVWCFFSAIVSLSLYKIQRDNSFYLSEFKGQ